MAANNCLVMFIYIYIYNFLIAIFAFILIVFRQEAKWERERGVCVWGGGGSREVHEPGLELKKYIISITSTLFKVYLFFTRE